MTPTVWRDCGLALTNWVYMSLVAQEVIVTLSWFMNGDILCLNLAQTIPYLVPLLESLRTARVKKPFLASSTLLRRMHSLSSVADKD